MINLTRGESSPRRKKNHKLKALLLIPAALALMGAKCLTKERRQQYHREVIGYASCMWWEEYSICICTDGKNWAFQTDDEVCSPEEEEAEDEDEKGPPRSKEQEV